MAARVGALTTALALSLPAALTAPVSAAEAVESEVPPPFGASDRESSGNARGQGAALPRPTAVPSGFSHRNYYSTSRDARTYWSQDNRSPTGGWLRAGHHSFYCQAQGQPHSDGEGGYATWWALTDDDNGNRDVFVSATAFQLGEPWQPIEGLPRC